MATVENLEKGSITGKILRFTFDTPGIADKYFELQCADRSKCFCKGKIIPGKNISIGSTLKLFGEWRVNENPKYRSMGKQFYFKTYEILTSTDTGLLLTRKPLAYGKPVKVIRRPRVGNSIMAAATSGDTIAEKVSAHLKAIGVLKFTYQFNKPKHNTIAQHVLKQLNERIILSTREEKDFFFLTALLDRNVSDKKVQLFRRLHPDFKLKLIQCWRDAKPELQTAISNIGYTSSDFRYLKTIRTKSNSFKILQDDVPGENGVNQLLACLKVIWDKYNLTMTRNIHELSRGLSEEKSLKQYLIGIHGVKHKIANWALTNITGHWFVIDEPNIKPMIKKDLSDSIPPGMEVSAEKADAIFEHWFGKLNETNNEYERFSRKQFAAAFPDFPPDACEYLPFIITQYLWFYGKKINMSKSAQKIHWAMSNESEIVLSSIPKPVLPLNTPAFDPHKIDWQKVQSSKTLVQLLPTNLKTKEIWPSIPGQLREEIINRVRNLAASRNFAAPAEWDGSFKDALLLMEGGRLPNGFKISLKL